MTYGIDFVCVYRDCLRDAIQYNEEPEIKCPFVDKDYTCCATLQEREIKAVSSTESHMIMYITISK
jgi:hypothetical protein